MLGERPPRSVDEAVAIGERLSALLMAAYLESQGTPAVAVNAAGMRRHRRRLRQRLAADGADAGEGRRATAAAALEKGVLPVVTGFNGATADGRPTTLGRGGSDFSASILAAALDAAELWIWTDVDGIMSADPRLVPDARVLDEVTYSEAAELAYNGAKVLHPRTLAPLVEKQDSGLEQEQLRAGEAGHEDRAARSRRRTARARSPRWRRWRWSRWSPPARS